MVSIRIVRPYVQRQDCFRISDIFIKEDSLLDAMKCVRIVLIGKGVFQS